MSLLRWLEDHRSWCTIIVSMSKRQWSHLMSLFRTATAITAAVAAFELVALAWIQWRYMDMPPVAAATKVTLGGAVALTVGNLIGSSCRSQYR